MKLTNPVEIIKKSVDLFFKKENLIYFLKVYWVLVPFAVFFFIQQYFVKLPETSGGNLPNIDFQHLNWYEILFFPVGLVYLIVSFWTSVAGIMAVDGVVDGNLIPVKEVFQKAWKKLWLFSLLSIMVGLIEGAGLILLIVPGIIFMVWYSFAGFELITKGVGIGAAMKESKKLVSGKFFKVLGRLIMFGLFGLIVQTVFNFIPNGLGSIILPLFGGLLIMPYFLLYKELSG